MWTIHFLSFFVSCTVRQLTKESGKPKHIVRTVNHGEEMKQIEFELTSLLVHFLNYFLKQTEKLEKPTEAPKTLNT